MEWGGVGGWERERERERERKGGSDGWDDEMMR